MPFMGLLLRGGARTGARNRPMNRSAMEKFRWAIRPAQFPVVWSSTGVSRRALDLNGSGAIHASIWRGLDAKPGARFCWTHAIQGQNAMTPPASSAAVAHRED